MPGSHQKETQTPPVSRGIRLKLSRLLSRLRKKNEHVEPILLSKSSKKLILSLAKSETTKPTTAEDEPIVESQTVSVPQLVVPQSYPPPSQQELLAEAKEKYLKAMKKYQILYDKMAGLKLKYRQNQSWTSYFNQDGERQADFGKMKKLLAKAPDPEGERFAGLNTYEQYDEASLLASLWHDILLEEIMEVHKKIEVAYKQAYYYTDPTSSGLYNLLSPIVSSKPDYLAKTVDEKLLAVHAYQADLKFRMAEEVEEQLKKISAGVENRQDARARVVKEVNAKYQARLDAIEILMDFQAVGESTLAFQH